MTTLWRISASPSLEGRAAEFASGRWHTAESGKRIVYLSEHPALALVETLVNLQFGAAIMPATYWLTRVGVDSKETVQTLETSHLPAEWRDQLATTRALGDAWLAERSSALLRIPSAPVPESFNYLLNLRHPHAGSVKAQWQRQLNYDRRLFRLMPPASAR
ncbi:MAG: RES family NAD+ phosphorylase [Terriglobales bacterium]